MSIIPLFAGFSISLIAMNKWDIFWIKSFAVEITFLIQWVDGIRNMKSELIDHME